MSTANSDDTQPENDSAIQSAKEGLYWGIDFFFGTLVRLFLSLGVLFLAASFALETFGGPGNAAVASGMFGIFSVTWFLIAVVGWVVLKSLRSL
jgi:hypothetical protein